MSKINTTGGMTTFSGDATLIDLELVDSRASNAQKKLDDLNAEMANNREYFERKAEANTKRLTGKKCL